MTTEFFVCPCPGTGNVILDGNDQGPNKDDSGSLNAKKCNAGLHGVSLQCSAGKTCSPPEVEIIIEATDPINPKEVPFQCAV